MNGLTVYTSFWVNIRVKRFCGTSNKKAPKGQKDLWGLVTGRIITKARRQNVNTA
jgi:hypothetical protein